MSTTFTNFVYKSIKPYCKYILLLALTLIYGGLFMVLSPYLLKQIIDNVALYTGDLNHIWTNVNFWVYLYLGNWLIAIIAFRAIDWSELKIYPSLRKDIIIKLFSYLLGHSHHYFQNNFSGGLSNRINDMHSGVARILRKIDQAFFNIMMVLIAVPLFFYTHPYISVLFITWLIAFVAIAFIFSKQIIPLSITYAKSKTTLNGQTVDALSNVSTTRFFSHQDYETQRTTTLCNDVVNNEQSLRYKIIHMRIWWDVLMLTSLALVFYTLIYLYSQKLVTIGDFTFVFNLYMNVFIMLWQLAGQYPEFSEELGKCYQALEILNKSHDIQDTQDAYTLENINGEIAFENVYFHYNKGKCLFKNKNIIIKPKEKIGLVGFSGSGKSTFVNLILRLFDVESGQITIDGHPIQDVTQASLRKNISVIPQDPSLFHRSLRDNIRYGNPDATDAEIIHASKLAHCHEFAETLEEGYDTLVGERGVKLSGGQRQRIAIARAFLEKAPILILDEATSALDSVTEQLIQESLDTLMQDHTTIVIAHRLSTLAQMDRILVFDKGHIIEEGAHKALLKKKGAYAKMWDMQSGGFLPATDE